MYVIKLTITLLTLFITPTVFGDIVSPSFPTSSPTAPSLSSKAYLLIDFNSNQILAEKNIHDKVEPASLTKMMTMYVVDQELKNKNLSIDDLVTISKKAWQAPGSRMFVNVDSKVRVGDLMNGIIIQSGNDASIALAEHIASSEQNFADLMNSYAKVLGMNNTNFVNATGLPDENHYTTTMDMAILARAVIRDFPDTYKIYAEKSFKFNGIKQVNRNRLLWRTNIVDGIKTGHTDSAGFCLVASGKRNNMRLISIVMGAKNDEIRMKEAHRLLAWGFRFFETHQLYKSGDTLQNIRVWMSNEAKTDIGLIDDLYITIPNDQYKQLKASLNIPKIIKAPLEKGAQIGTYQIQLHDKVLIEQPIVALSPANKGSLWIRLKDYIALSGHAVWEKFNVN